MSSLIIKKTHYRCKLLFCTDCFERHDSGIHEICDFCAVADYEEYMKIRRQDPNYLVSSLYD